MPWTGKAYTRPVLSSVRMSGERHEVVVAFFKYVCGFESVPLGSARNIKSRLTSILIKLGDTVAATCAQDGIKGIRKEHTR